MTVKLSPVLTKSLLNSVVQTPTENVQDRSITTKRNGDLLPRLRPMSIIVSRALPDVREMG